MKKENRIIVTSIIISALIVSSGAVIYAVINPYQKQTYVAISALNGDKKAVGVITVENNTTFTFYFMVQNFLGTTGYFKVDVLKGVVTNGSNPEFSDTTLFKSELILLSNNAKYLVNITDSLNFNSTNQVYIYYLVLYMYNFENKTLQKNGQWVAMQVKL